MCTSYGVSQDRLSDMRGLPPIDVRESAPDLASWAGSAKITGKNARNLNPVFHAAGGERRMDLGWWSLWRDGSGPFGRFSFNARTDSLMRYWKKPFQTRALLPASWYDEGRKRWELSGGPLFAIAAVTSTVTEDATGTPLLTYAMVTRHGVGEASTVVSSRGEPRMPLVLPRDMWDDWLDPERPGDQSLVAEVELGSDEISRQLTADGWS